MNRKKVAFHEASHVVIIHYAGIEITKISPSEVEINPPPQVGKNDQQKLKDQTFKQITIAASGLIGEYMFAGDSFWNDHTRKDLLQSEDMKILKGLTVIPKDAMHLVLRSTETFLESVWGKVEYVADRILDHDKPHQDINFEIMKTQRQRKPEHSAARLIKFIMTELYGG